MEGTYNLLVVMPKLHRCKHSIAFRDLGLHVRERRREVAPGNERARRRTGLAVVEAPSPARHIRAEAVTPTAGRRRRAVAHEDKGDRSRGMRYAGKEKKGEDCCLHFGRWEMENRDVLGMVEAQSTSQDDI